MAGNALVKWYIYSIGVILQLESQFARWGIPDEIRFDGGSQFSSYEFKRFCDKREIVHTMSTPHHPTGTQAIQTAKHILRQKTPLQHS